MYSPSVAYLPDVGLYIKCAAVRMPRLLIAQALPNCLLPSSVKYSLPTRQYVASAGSGTSSVLNFPGGLGAGRGRDGGGPMMNSAGSAPAIRSGVQYARRSSSNSRCAALDKIFGMMISL